MKKVTLSLDALRVESFETAVRLPDLGTVHAMEITPPRYSCIGSCNESCTCPIASVCDCGA
jgi:hypothetical protein